MSTVPSQRSTNSKPNVIVVVDWAYSERDHQRFGVKYFVDCGFNVTVFNFCEITFPHVKLADSFDASSVVSYLRIRNRNQFKFLIKSFESPTTVLIMAGGSPRVAWYFRQMKKAGFRMGLVTATVHPVLDSNGIPTSLRAKVIKAISDPRKAVKYLISRIVQITTYFPAVDFFCAAGEFAEQMAHPLLGPNTKLIPIQSFDFDRMWEVAGLSVPAFEKPFAVFLDQLLPSHPDYLACGVDPFIEADDYYPGLREIFGAIETKYSCVIIVAAHPRYELSHMETAVHFGGRLVLKNQTPLLIANCCLVIAHTSTALSFGVLAGKPLLLIDSSKFVGTEMETALGAIRRDLRPAFVDLNSAEEIPDRITDLELPCDRRAAYIRRYIGSLGAKGEPSYVSVSRECL